VTVCHSTEDTIRRRDTLRTTRGTRTRCRFAGYAARSCLWFDNVAAVQQQNSMRTRRSRRMLTATGPHTPATYLLPLVDVPHYG